MTSRVIVEADGGSRGNPGIAGYGAVVFDAESRQVLAERSAGIGIASNNVAEYRGLIAGLTAAQELGASDVEVRMDSKLVVEQMSGRWKVKHPDMIELAAQARKLLAQFRSVDFIWVPRSENAYADRLANAAMDGAEPAATSKPPGWTNATGTPTRMLLLRHGQTELSVQRRYSGRGNPPLTDIGRGQAKSAAQHLARKGHIAAVVTSPLDRARTTAAAVAEMLDVELYPMEALTETDFGAWEGLTFAEAAQRDPELHARWLGDTSVRPPGGESFDEVRVRVTEARDAIAGRYGATNVVVVSHVTPIKTLLQLALDVGPSLLYRLHLDLASLSIAEFYADGAAAVRLVNDTSFLQT
ncbi:bifunctional RNase H/acid phosphatase [Skermania sp. ID1734]|uniref:bifunctional RNase H/acid phosphatase n=1 Tax=Skermania sp. ID1734 TaxID=2597516 RepID=UPI0011811050|nr:bifunctional RNase H/acid phosphatase [Skermania sp. ID1734]TSE01085.1 bifunctional RNase H/acid phosphatase [Skermania sp. ID1734]